MQFSSVPYHKPKQRSLKEFLARRSIMEHEEQMKAKPLLKAAAAIKMTGQDLIEYANKINQRIQEAEVFFQEESDEEDGNAGNEEEEAKEPQTVSAEEEPSSFSGENVKNEEKVAEDDPMGGNPKEAGDTSEVQETPSKGASTEAEPTEMEPDMDVSMADVETQFETEPETLQETEVAGPSSTKQAIQIHTERTELDDELDGMDASQAPPAKAPLSKRQLDIAALATIAAPKLGGGTGMVIDLDTNEITPKPKSDVDLFVERFVQSAIVKPTNHTEEQEIR